VSDNSHDYTIATGFCAGPDIRWQPQINPIPTKPNGPAKVRLQTVASFAEWNDFSDSSLQGILLDSATRNPD